MKLGLVCTALALVCAGSVAAEDTALLLGNRQFENFDRVRNGAGIIETKDNFERQGFSVYALTNGDWDTISSNLEGFMNDLDRSDSAIVALSGRFATDGQRTWFFASDAPVPRTILDAGQNALSVETAMNVLALHQGRAVLILADDGADDVLADYLIEGIGDLDIPQGVTVIRTDPATANNLLRDVVSRPGADLYEAVDGNRRIRGYGYLPSGYMFLETRAEGSVDIVIEEDPDNPIVVDPEVEETRWQAALAQDSEAGYRAYLRIYPQGKYATQSRINIDKILSEPNRAARLEEEAMGLTRNQRREIQRDLSILDFNTRGIDGIFGPGSRSAITNWQQQNGFEQTSYLIPEQISRLDAQAQRRAAALEAEAERRRQQELRLDRAYWEETGAHGDEIGLRAYLERYRDGAFAEIAQQRLVVIEKAKRAEAEAEDRAQWDQARTAHSIAAYQQYLRRYPAGVFRTEAEQRIRQLQEAETGAGQVEQYRAQERALGLNPVTARLVEAKLASLGLEPGRVDGRLDRDTRRALRRYQRARGLPVTGYLSEQTIVRLLADSIGLE
jgi:peptidoglycan hydrolase-like protein with peptidoglycan-binding domain